MGRMAYRFLLQGTYLIYHRFEPVKPAIHALLLLLTPCLLAFHLFVQHRFASLLSTVVYSCTVYWAVITFLVVAYRLSPFHPLAKYPGPVTARISKLWMAFCVVAEGHSHSTLKRLHERYGEVLRTGEPDLYLVLGIVRH